jgi:hypothetical protein
MILYNLITMVITMIYIQQQSNNNQITITTRLQSFRLQYHCKKILGTVHNGLST